MKSFEIQILTAVPPLVHSHRRSKRKSKNEMEEMPVAQGIYILRNIKSDKDVDVDEKPERDTKSLSSLYVKREKFEKEI